MTKLSRIWRIGATVLLLLMLWPNCEAKAQPAPPARQLFQESLEELHFQLVTPTARRSREVRIDSEALHTLRVRAEDESPIRLNLFDDAAFNVRVDRAEARAHAQFTLTGTLLDDDGKSGGEFLIVTHEDAVVLNAWTHAGRAFELRPMQNRHVLQELDLTKFGPCGCGEAQLIRSPQHHQPRQAESGMQCPDWIDVLIMYTSQAESAAGGANAIHAVAYAGIASSNIAFEASGVATRLRAVQLAKTDYQENGNISNSLTRLRMPNDGYMDEVHELRERAGADLVLLLAGSTGGFCGLAYTMTNPGPAFSSFAFSVVSQSCAVGNLTFAHEVGHNLGCQHDHDDGLAGAYSFSHGHRFTGASGRLWRTVMATTPGDRVPRFSNPDVLFDGIPTGVPIGESGEAHNAHTINLTANTVGAFRSTLQNDCNRNGQPDHCEIASGETPDLNENGVPDECDWQQCDAPPTLNLIADEPESFEEFGTAVAFGSTRIVVGAEFAHHVGPISGRAYVFARRGDRWVQEAILIGSDTASFDHFGRSVAISADDQVILVGANRANIGPTSDAGAVYVFSQSQAGAWTQQAKLTAPQPQQLDYFGWSLAIQQVDRNYYRAAIGAPLNSTAIPNTGAVYIFEGLNGTWSHQATLAAGDSAQLDEFGYAVALSGTRAVVGARMHDAGALNAGAAYVFAHDNNHWSQQAKLLPADAMQEDRIGQAVAIHHNSIIIGSRGGGSPGQRSGSAYVYDFDGQDWTLMTKLMAAHSQTRDGFGSAVAMHEDIAAVGAPLHQMEGTTGGAVFFFRRSGTRWEPQAAIAPDDAVAFDNFGSSLAIDVTGSMILAGAPLDDHSQSVDGGSIAVFSVETSLPDCNANGQLDQCDINAGLSVDLNANGIPDECEASSTCPGDIAPAPAGDGDVSIEDLLAILNAWGPCPASPAPASCPADISGDSLVNVDDLLAVLEYWGTCK